jgi:hypothetical protein
MPNWYENIPHITPGDSGYPSGWTFGDTGPWPGRLNSQELLQREILDHELPGLTYTIPSGVGFGSAAAPFGKAAASAFSKAMSKYLLAAIPSTVSVYPKDTSIKGVPQRVGYVGWLDNFHPTPKPLEIYNAFQANPGEWMVELRVPATSGNPVRAGKSLLNELREAALRTKNISGAKYIGAETLTTSTKLEPAIRPLNVDATGRVLEQELPYRKYKTLPDGRRVEVGFRYSTPMHNIWSAIDPDQRIEPRVSDIDFGTRFIPVDKVLEITNPANKTAITNAFRRIKADASKYPRPFIPYSDRMQESYLDQGVDTKVTMYHNQLKNLWTENYLQDYVDRGLLTPEQKTQLREFATKPIALSSISPTPVQSQLNESTPIRLFDFNEPEQILKNIPNRENPTQTVKQTAPVTTSVAPQISPMSDRDMSRIPFETIPVNRDIIRNRLSQIVNDVEQLYANNATSELVQLHSTPQPIQRLIQRANSGPAPSFESYNTAIELLKTNPTINNAVNRYRMILRQDAIQRIPYTDISNTITETVNTIFSNYNGRNVGDVATVLLDIAGSPQAEHLLRR